ncbi:MAG: hypothetical protein RIR26_2121 [Pseudomonadota bacterium]
MKKSLLFASVLFSSVITMVGCGAASLQEQRPLSLGIENKTSTPSLRSEASVAGKSAPARQADQTSTASDSGGTPSGQTDSHTVGKLGIQSGAVSQAKSVPQSTSTTAASSSSGSVAVSESSSTSSPPLVVAVAQDETKSAFDADLERRRNQIQFVSYVYQACLGRNAEPDGLIFWSNLLAAGQKSFDEVKFAICNQSLEGQLSIAYREILGRFPDAEGRTGWMNVLNSGMSLASVRAELMNSAERASLTSAQLLTRFQQINSVIAGYEFILADLKRRTV